MPPLDDDELHAFHKDFLKLVGRFDNLEKDFIVYQEAEATRQEAVVSSTNKNTEALLKINLTMERHIEETADMTTAFGNVRGAVKVLDFLGRISGIILKISLGISLMSGLAYAWMSNK